MREQSKATFLTILKKWCVNQSHSPLILAPKRTSLSYGKSLEFIDQTIATLRDHGIRDGSCVALIVPDSPEMVSCFLTVSSIATACPINHSDTFINYEQTLSDLTPDLVIVGDGASREAIRSAESLHCPIARLHPRLEAPAGTFELEFTTAPLKTLNHEERLKDYRLILQTSGSTGRPKYVPHTAQALILGATHTAERLGLNTKDIELLMNPLFHSHGIVSGVLLPLISGGAVACCGRFVSDQFEEWLKAFQPTWYSTGPTVHREIMNHVDRIDPKSLKSLRFVRSGAAPFDSKFIQLIESRLQVDLVEAYGLSEVPHVSCSKVGEATPNSVGQTVSPEISIINQTGNLLEAGSIGEVALRGPTLFHGYLSEQSLTPLYLTDWFRTGDLGYLDDYGNLFITGRIKDIINKGGEKIMPLEVDQFLSSHPSIQNAQCFSIPHPSLGEDIAAAVILKNNTYLSEADLKEFIKEKLGSQKTPTRILFVDTFPIGATGKQIRSALYPALKDQLKPKRTRPNAGIETIVAHSFETILDIDHVYRDSHFFLLGGDSLSALSVLSEITKQTRANLPISILFKNPEVSSLANAIEHQLRSIGRISKDHPPDDLIKINSKDLSFAEQRIAFLDTVSQRKQKYILPCAFTISGPLDSQRMLKAIKRIVWNHPPLRTRYQLIEGEFHFRETPNLGLDYNEIEFTQSDAETFEALIKAELEKPFDLRKGLKIRCTLFRYNATLHKLLVCIHHIACDGWSLELFGKELLRQYSQSQDELPKVSNAYRQYAASQKQLAALGAYEDSLNHWERQLSGLPSLNFKKIYTPKDDRTVARNSFQLSNETKQALENLAHTHDASLQILLLAVTHCLLARWTNQDDFAIGVPTSGRSNDSLNSLIGLFVNTLAVRNPYDQKKLIKDFINSVRDNSLAAYDIREVPFDLVVQRLQPERHDHHNTLVQTVFQLTEFGSGEYDNEDIHLERTAIPQTSTRFNLEFYLKKKASSIDVEIVGTPELFSDSDLDVMGRTFRIIADQFVKNPSQKLCEIDIIHPEELSKLVRWNQFNINPDNTVSIHEQFNRIAKAHPKRIAVTYDGNQIDYATTHKESHQIAARLQHLGIQSGDRIAILEQNSLLMPVALIAILKVGGIYVPLDPDSPHSVTAGILNEIKPALVICASQVPTYQIKGPRYLTLDQLSESTEELSFSECKSSSEDAAYIMYSSGTTGKPKGIVIPHRGVVRLVNKPNYCSINHEDRFIQLASPAFDASTFEIWGALLNGATLIIPDIKQPSLDQLETLITSNNVSILWLTAGLFNLVVDEAPKLLRHVKQLLTGGDIVSPSHVKQIQQRFPDITIINGYGPTENTTFSCCYNINTWAKDTETLPIGHSIQGSTTLVLDSNQQLCPPGVTGEIYLHGLGLSHGYWNETEYTAEKFIHLELTAFKGLFYRSGDYGRYLSDGRILFEGRKDGQVKVRGFRVELGEIEHHLRQHSTVESAAAFATSNEGNQTTTTLGVAVVTSRAISEQELRSYLHNCMPAWMVPDIWHFVKALPLTQNGKVNRQLLERLSTNNQVDHNRDIALEDPNDPLLQSVLTCWQNAFPNQRITRSSNFFSLGGHSLQAMRLMAQLKKQLRRQIPLTSIFKYPTFSQFVESIRGSNTSECTALIPLSKGRSNAIVVMVHGFGGELFCYNEVWNQLEDIECIGLQALEHSGGKKPDSFEAMCRGYAQELSDAAYNRPLILCGFSLGGMVAFETARQAKNLGVHIQEVIVLDTRPQNLPMPLHLSAIVIHMIQQVPAYLKELIVKPRKAINLRKKWRKFRPVFKDGGRKTVDSTTTTHTSDESIEYYSRIALTFNPLRTALPVTLIRSSRSTPKAALRPRWHYLSECNLSTISVDLDHLEMLGDTGSALLIKTISQKVEDSEANTTSCII